ncbi:hypothetical protein CkaCkLH20_06379 [Colletotrichum karsti]|uniref:Uncharacterized protein n=1 Tax=Colletotrichum karsti TaxID=1095194 RepID=A0A9P6I259_9PEZI|nr:uncharacterized protein CkaCkLH20_06379 [Colletotrichum karsti]KAF9875933.1 hypothetical protein CkaCkLH20_06379 [Colletotrichum karsti]
MASFPWGGPAWNELDVAQNCSAFGDYAAWVVTNDYEPPFPAVSTFWRAVVPEVNSTQPTNGQIIDWHEWVRSNRSTLASQVRDFSSCRPELCQRFGSEVDGGLAGFGLLASYGLESVLLTVYCIFAILNFLKRRKNDNSLSEEPSVRPGFLGRVNEALRGTTYDLFTAAAFLSLGIQATVIYNQVSPATYRYNSSLQLIVSAFAFYPLATMLPLILNSVRRSWLKGAVLIGLFIIHTAAWVLCTNNAQEDYYYNERVINLCPQNHPPEAAVSAAMFTMAAMVWMPPLFGLCLSVVLCFYRCNNRKMWQAKWLNMVAKGAMILFAGANFICMWGAWIILVIYFSRAHWKTEDTWSLGQSLALTPWIPVLVELASILTFGTEGGFVGRLPVEFRVVRNEKALHRRERDSLVDEPHVHGGNGA